MTLALRLAVACLVIAAPTVLYLGLLRGLERLRDDALLLRIAESDDAPEDASNVADRALDRRTVRGDGSVRADGSGRGDAPGGPRAAARPPEDRRGSPQSESVADSAPESVACSNCDAANMLGARYCGECLGKLR